MAAQAPLLGIDPKMYRHFAVITIVLSAAIAMFANGPSEAPPAPPAAGVAPLPDAAASKAPPRTEVKTRTGTLIDARTSQPAMASDIDAGPDPVDSVDTSVAPVQPQAGQIDIEIDPRDLARMSAAQRDDALKQLQAEKKRREAAGPYRPSPMELRALRSASALRSGSEGAD